MLVTEDTRSSLLMLGRIARLRNIAWRHHTRAQATDAYARFPHTNKAVPHLFRPIGNYERYTWFT
jgi:hypothetical protein